MKQLKTLKAVYSYMFPEVRKAIFQTIIPGPAMTSISVDMGFNEFLSKFMKSPDEMDSMHEPILKKWVKLHKDVLPGIQKFKFSYPTAGSEEGIREFMTHLFSQGVYEAFVLDGEYEGYSEVAKTRFLLGKDLCGYGVKDIRITSVSVDTALNLRDKWFFISNPSARNGNVLTNWFINELCDNGNKIFYDLAYLDSVDPTTEFDLSHKNIKVVVMSFSKPYGLFYWRFGGLFSKEPIPSLYGNKWFKVVPAMLVADRIMDTIPRDYLYKKYRPVQEQIVSHLIEEFQLPFSISDALLLANIKRVDVLGFPRKRLDIIEPFLRGRNYRFCLKPYYEEWERRERLK